MFRDREYLSRLINTALPIAIQNLVSSSLNAVGVLMIGQLGAVSIAAVGLANQIFFLYNLMMFGIISGACIFTAQFWGNGDVHGIRKVVGLSLGLSLIAGMFFTVLALVFPRAAMGIYTNDPQVIELGVQYLQIIGTSYLITGISLTFGMQLRSTGNVRLPMVVSVVALGLGAGLNYVLIFGKLGLPVMGVSGAALGTAIARLLECVAMVAVTYLGHQPTAVYWQDMRDISAAFLKRFYATVLPVTANEAIWSLGITIYNIIYARVGTEAIAAVNIASTIESLFFTVFIGLCNASAILIGNRIGAGEEAKAYVYARRGIFLGLGLAVIAGVSMALISAPVVTYFKVSAVTANNARNILLVLACAYWARVSNMMLIVGILRSGGDTRFSLYLDAGTVWFVGIPMALLGAYVFHLPIYWIVAMVMMDDVTKMAVGLYRFLSKKWINNLAQIPA